MTINSDLFLAILALDSYNRGYRQGIAGLSSQSGTSLGNAIIYQDSQSADGSAQAAGFYGIAYTLEADGALKTVISYRGTDNYNPFAAGNDILNGWTTSAGFANQSQAKLAIDFYQAVTERDAYSTGAPPNVILTGHSLGGALAGLVGALSGAQAVGFDHAPFGVAAVAQAQAEADRRAGSAGVDPASVGVRIPDVSQLTGYYVDGEINSGLRNGDLQHTLAGLIGSISPKILAGIKLSGLDNTSNTVAYENLLHPEELGVFGANFSGWDALARHSQALLVTLLYGQKVWTAPASQPGGLGKSDDWQAAAKYVLADLFDADIAKALGRKQSVNGGDGTGFADEGSQLATIIAYSAISEGERPFGDVGIGALFDDTSDLGKVVKQAEQDPTFISNFFDDETKTDIASIVTEYAGLLASNKAVGSDNSTLRNGILNYNDTDGTLSVNLSAYNWHLNSANEPLQILKKSSLVDNIINRVESDTDIVADATNWYSTHSGIDAISLSDLVDSISFDTQGSTNEASPFYTSLTALNAVVSLSSGAGLAAVPGEAGDKLLIGSSKGEALFGGDGRDVIFGGGGDDTLRGGKGDDWLDGGAGVDTADYSNLSAPIKVKFSGPASYAGDQPLPKLTVEDGTGGTDTLQSVEIIKGTAGEDKFSIDGLIPKGYSLTFDANGGQSGGVKDILNAKGYTDQSGLKISINLASGAGYVRARDGQGGVINLLNFHTDIVGSDYSDIITDVSTDEHTVDGGAGDDVITVAGANAVVNGGAGNDAIHVQSAAATIEFGIGGGSDVVEFDNGDGAYNLVLQNLNPEDVEFIAGGRDVYWGGVPEGKDDPEGFWFQFFTIRVTSTGDQITFLENGRNVGPDGNGSAIAYNKGLDQGWDEPGGRKPIDGKLDSVTFADGTVFDQEAIWNGLVGGGDRWSYPAETHGYAYEYNDQFHSPASYLDYVNRTYLQADPIGAPPPPPDQAVDGTPGDDALQPGYGNDTVTGGAGNDAIQESPGNDTYVWNSGDGNDQIVGSSLNDGVNTLQLGVGISQADLQFAVASDGSGLTLTFAGQTGSVTLGDELVGDGFGVDQVRFADGTVLTRAQLLAAAASVITAAQTTITGTSGADFASTPHGNFVVTGGRGDDFYITNGSGSGTYNFASADGHDEILGFGVGTSRNDILNLTDVLPSGVQLSRSGDDLVVTINATGASVKVDYQFAGDGGDDAKGLGLIKFADGSSWTRSEIRRLALGLGADTPPVADAITANVVEGAPLIRGSLTASDPDADDALKFALDTRVDGLVVGADGTWSFDPTAAAYQSLAAGEQLTLTASYHVTDLAGATSASTLAITVTGVNDVPAGVQQLVNQRLVDGEAFSYDVVPAFADPDSQLTLSAALDDGSALPEWLRFAAGRFTGTVPEGDSSVYNIVVTASDGEFQTQSVFHLHVGIANQAPVAQGTLPNLTGNIGAPFVLPVPTNNFYDPDYDVLVFSATLADGTALPDWLAFSNGHLIGTPPADAADDYSIRVTASDGEVGTDSLFSLFISPDALINGTSGNDNITLPQTDFIANPGGGNDNIEVSGDGAGTILFAKRDGFDFLDNPGDGYNRDDTLYLTNVTPDDVTLTRYGDYLDVTISSTGNDFAINRQFAGDTQDERLGVSYIKFADGTIWGRDAIRANAIDGYGGNAALFMTSALDVSATEKSSASSSDLSELDPFEIDNSGAGLAGRAGWGISHVLIEGEVAQSWFPQTITRSQSPLLASVATAASQLAQQSAVFGSPDGTGALNQIQHDHFLSGLHQWGVAKAAML